MEKAFLESKAICTWQVRRMEEKMANVEGIENVNCLRVFTVGIFQKFSSEHWVT